DNAACQQFSPIYLRKLVSLRRKANSDGRQLAAITCVPVQQRFSSYEYLHPNTCLRVQRRGLAGQSLLSRVSDWRDGREAAPLSSGRGCSNTSLEQRWKVGDHD
ncbi:hypothetical protein PIB30_067295, partial [Stylosanthes scabra]|nr:hypothetical protein [Stylosanthes scabra]